MVSLLRGGTLELGSVCVVYYVCIMHYYTVMYVAGMVKVIDLKEAYVCVCRRFI